MEAKADDAPSATLSSAELALMRSLPTSDIKIGAFLAPFKGANDGGAVVLGAELSGFVADGPAEARVEVSFIAIDAQGRTRTAPPKTLPLPKNATDTTGSVTYLDRLILPRGRHEVRMVVQQLGGRTGSVIAHVDIPDYSRGALELSGLLLASRSAAAEPVIGDHSLTIADTAALTARRTFARNDVLVAFAEIYAEARTRPEDVAITSTITTALGANIRKQSAVPVVAPASGRLSYTSELRLSDLVPGDYVWTVEAQLARRSAVRRVPFSIVE